MRVAEGAKGGPLDVMLRRRTGNGCWATPESGQRIDAGAWQLSEEQVLDLEIQLEEGEHLRWVPPKPSPDLWLWLRG